jgi:CHAP domain
MIGVFNQSLVNKSINRLNNYKQNVSKASFRVSQNKKINNQPLINNNQSNNKIGSLVDQFYNDNKGKSLTNPEGTFANQCVSSSRKFVNDVLKIPLKAGWNAWDGYANYGKNAFGTDKWDKVQDFKSLQPGDLFFVAPNKNGAGGVGHVGIVKSAPDKDGNITVVDSNWEGQPLRERKTSINKINGVLRAKI